VQPEPTFRNPPKGRATFYQVLSRAEFFFPLSPPGRKKEKKKKRHSSSGSYRSFILKVNNMEEKYFARG
jgi:hypothetical protein